MIISLIAAMAENRVIGLDGKMPWNIPSDRKYFLLTTKGHPIILGRKTFESIGHPLPKRKNIILTRRTSYRAEGCIIAHDLRAALAEAVNADEVFICGGGTIFSQTIFFADRIYLTVVHANIAGDTFFPLIPLNFRETERTRIEDVIPYDLVLYARSPQQKLENAHREGE